MAELTPRLTTCAEDLSKDLESLHDSVADAVAHLFAAFICDEEQGEPPAELDGIAHLLYHQYAVEERLMAERRYPRRDHHMQAHQLILRLLMRVCDRGSALSAADRRDLAIFLLHAVLDHEASEDEPLTRFLQTRH